VWYQPDAVELPPALLEEIRGDWERRVAAAGRVLLVDDPLAQLLDHRVEPDALSLTLGRSRYAHWQYSCGRGSALEAKHGPGSACRPLALCAALVTADGRLVVQHRSDRVAEGAGELHVPGGHLNPDLHLRDGLPHPTESMRVELHEELALTDTELEDGHLLGFIENGETGKPELLYRWRLTLDADEVRERAREAVDSFEARELLFPRLEELAGLEEKGPVAIPTRALISILCTP